MPYIGAVPDKGNFADLNGGKLIIDADADTSITADTDDQIDIEISGADDFHFTANNLKVELIKKTKSNKFSVKKISNNKYRLLVGPFENFNALKNIYIGINNLGFEDLQIHKE